MACNPGKHHRQDVPGVGTALLRVVGSTGGEQQCLMEESIRRCTTTKEEENAEGHRETDFVKM
ncbi:hypothetical protein E2C01_086431 [Portunus trituberculatus]|uniref:Uncharacterized protein n=1 Tax=Portunus trituberculatus TaxID=210409 RepID=A0A5B7JBG5_PORTR|nr:hypothetical protein [Portunus trituberculatus]